MLFGERLAIGSAQTRDVCLESWRLAVDLAEDVDLPVLAVKRAAGREELVLEVDGELRRYKVCAATAGSARGLSADLVVLDELREHKDWGAYSALEKTRRARPSSQAWAISTEGDHQSVVLHELQRQGREAVAAGTSRPLAYYEWSASPHLAADDPAAWAEANPGLGHILDVETLAAEQATDPEAVFATESLCRPVRTLATPWLPAGGWGACTDSSTVPDGAPGVVFGVDAGPALDHASIATAWARPDGRIHTEVIATYDGPTASVAAEQRLRGLCETWRPKTVAVLARGPVEAVAARVGAATGVPVLAVNGADMDRGVRGFYSSAIARRLVHPPDPLLAAHLAAAQAGEPGLFVWKRRGPLDIDGAVAAVLAVWGVEHDPAPTFSWVAY